MTDREKAIVMAYTGICTLTGTKFAIFHKYIEDIMGRPVQTIELGTKFVHDEIKEKSEADFIALCNDESSSENQNKWIPVSERLPEEAGMYLCSYDDDDVGTSYFDISMNEFNMLHEQVTAWMPFPEPYKSEIPTGAEGSEEE